MRFAFASLLVVAFASVLLADERVVPEDSLVDAARRWETSVVRVRRVPGLGALADKRSSLQSWQGFAKSAEEQKPDMRGKAFNLLGVQAAAEGQGFYTGDGWTIATTASLVDGATRVEVVVDGTWTPVTVLGFDRDFSLALLKAPKQGAPLTLDETSELEAGRLVLGPSSTEGAGVEAYVVAGRSGRSAGRGFSRLPRILPSTSIGAPVLGADGRVRGLVASHASAPGWPRFGPSCATCHAPSSTPALQALFAPADAYHRRMPEFRLADDEWQYLTRYAGRRNDARAAPLEEPAVAHVAPARRLARALPDLIALGRVRKAYLGLVLDAAVEGVAGGAVMQVLPDSPLAGKMLPGDRILSIGGRRLEPIDDVAYEILALMPGVSTTIVVFRPNVGEVPVDVVPNERKGDASARGAAAFGFDAIPMTDELRAWLGTTDGGMVVSSVTPGGPADRAGLRKGDHLVSLADRVIGTPDEVAAAVDDALRKLAAGDKVVIDIVRDGQRVLLPLMAR